MQKTAGGFFQGVMRRLGRMGSAFREKPQATLDDYILEHFMLYHGLVGTSPENQRKFRDVRADVLQAVEHSSAVQLAIHLKLQPLFWEDKLEKIFQEAHASMPEKVKLSLLPETDPNETPPDADPLRHPDWRVRANAARAIGALQIEHGAPRMVRALQDQQDEQKAAFCHIAYALSNLQSSVAREALAEQLYNAEPWFRVDAAGALARWPLAEVQTQLMKAMLEPHTLSDYMAVTIARKHPPQDMLEHPDELLQEGALELVIGVLQAAGGPFNNDVVTEVSLPYTLPRVAELAKKQPTPRRLRAALALSRWITTNPDEFRFSDSQANDLIEQARAAQTEFQAPEFAQRVMSWLKEPGASRSAGEQRHAVTLVGEYGATEALPYLVPFLSPGSPAVNETLDTLRTLKAAQNAPEVVGLLNGLVDINDRTSRPLNKQSVFEDDVASTKTYWHGLGALGDMPGQASAEFLLKACRDFAADKRQQAVSSLARIAADPEVEQRYGNDVRGALMFALSDPSAGVRTAALQGIGELGLITFLPEIIQQAMAKETGVSRQAAESLRQLARKGHAAAVSTNVAQALSGQRDPYRRQRLQAVLDSLPR